MLPHRDIIGLGLRFSIKTSSLNTVDSSNALDNVPDSVRLAAEPPPFLSFRTKPPKSEEASQSVQANQASVGNPPATPLIAPTKITEQETQGDVEDRSMSEFYELRLQLVLNTLLWTGAFFGPVWYLYSLKVALNYLLGAISGVVYLRLLARNVEKLGPYQRSVGKSQLAVFIGVIIIAARVNGLEILPVFLGFLTYKVSILVYTLRIAMAKQ